MMHGAAAATPRLLAGKTALVTGASSGLGLAIARALAAAGAVPILVARRADALAAACADLAALGHPSRILAADITDAAAFRRACADLGPVDILVNNAGTNRPEPFEQVPEAHFDLVLGLNLRGTFFATQAVLPLMATGAVILNITSQMGHVGARNRTVYCASKHAVEGLTKALALELAPRGIRVNAIAPTFIETEMTRPMLENPAFHADVLSRIPLGHLGQPEDVAAAAVFLASDAARMMTGTSLLIDGGWTAQ